MEISSTTEITSENKEELQQAKLVRSKDVDQPEIKAWSFADLKQEEVNKTQKIRSDVLSDMRLDLEPELARQTTLLKKEAFKKAHKKGYDAGFKEGKELGKSQVIKQTEEALVPLIVRLENIVLAMQNPFQSVEKEVFESFANLSLNIAENFIQQEISKDNNWVIKAVEEAVKLLPEETVLLDIELNPEDIALIEKHKTDFSQTWQLKPNPAIPLGSCRVKQNFSIVENIWQTQLDDYLLKISEQIQVKDKVKDKIKDHQTPQVDI